LPDESIVATAACSCASLMITRWASLWADRHSDPASAQLSLLGTTL